MNDAPVIQSIGPPPERHAARVIAEMCRWLAGEGLRQRKRLKGEFTIARGNGLGNPKAQARFEKRLRKSGSEWLMGLTVDKGKRGRYGLRLLYWSVLNFNAQPLREDDPVPEKPWLAATYDEVWPKDSEKSYCCHIVVLSHHAMQRLAERCDARTYRDLLNALREIALAMFNDPPLTSDTGRVCKVPITNGVAIVENTADMGWVVKTVLPRELVPDAQVGPDVAEAEH